MATITRGIGLVCKDGYVIGANNKFATIPEDPFYPFYFSYFELFGREAAKNHKEMKFIISSVGADIDLVVPLMMVPAE